MYKSTGFLTNGQPLVETIHPPEKLEMCSKMGFQLEMATGWFRDVPWQSCECMAMAQKCDTVLDRRNEMAGS